MVLVTMIVTSGFIQIGYILGQAALDKYAHVAVSALEKDSATPPQKKSEPAEKSPLEEIEYEEFDGTLK
jgi:hypothetical protein